MFEKQNKASQHPIILLMVNSVFLHHVFSTKALLNTLTTVLYLGLTDFKKYKQI